MADPAQTIFAPFRLDTKDECLWRGEEKIRLTPKAFAVLGYLVEHASHLVKKEDLLKALWPGVYVSDAALTVCIAEIRKALADDPQTPQYVETVHRRGFRFIGKLAPTGDRSTKGDQRNEARIGPVPDWLVGREADLEALESHLEKASRGERQIVFVSGEPGIGKTALVDAFTKRASVAEDLWIASGQCIEQYGAGEAYLPVLQALGQLGRGPMRKRLIELLAQHAPSWLIQMPSLLSPAEFEALQRQHQGVTRERMLREMAEAVEALTAERPLLLVLEDLHWSDYSTLDLVSLLAQRREPARLLVIGTYRPVEVIVREHPLKAVKQALQLHGQSTELPLRFLSAPAVAEYLAVKFAGPDAHDPHLQDLASLIHRRTEGSPLFMVHAVEGLVANGTIAESQGRWQLAKGLEEVETEIPPGLRQMIEREVDRLAPEDRRLLEAASVAGQEFSAAAVAAGMEEEVLEVEERCEGLARREQWLAVVGPGEWADGTVAGRYRFLHALFPEVLYRRVPAGRRVDLHRRVGERQEAAYGGRAGEIAAALAMHFEHGRNYERAVQYLEQAAQTALGRSAYREAIGHITKELALLGTFSDTPERVRYELTLQIALGAALTATKGFAAPEVTNACERAQVLCREMGDTPQLFPVLAALWHVYVSRAELLTARALGEQFLRLAQSAHDAALLLEAHRMLGQTLWHMGEFAAARPHLEEGIALADAPQPRAQKFRFGVDQVVSCQTVAALVLWHLGYPEQAAQKISEARTSVQELSHPFSLASMLFFAASLHQLRGEGPAAQERAEELLALAAEQDFPFWIALGTMLRGWALAMQGQEETGIAQLRDGMSAFEAMGAKVGRVLSLTWLIGLCQRSGQMAEGLAAIDEAFTVVRDTEERTDEPELYRLKGEHLLAQEGKRRKARVNHVQSAEACFHKAIELSRRQGAKSWELRAVMSLSRLWRSQGKKKQARKLLVEIYRWFTEGFDTADLKDAKALLAELS